MNGTRSNTVIIRTPEGIVFPLWLAGPVTRCLAWVVDLACILAIIWLTGMVFNLFRLVAPDVTVAVMVVLYYLVIPTGYGILTEWYWRGQTIGKRLLRLRVMDEQGLRLRFSQIVVRNLLRFVDALPVFYMVGGLACLLSQRAQRLGDFAANTIVVRSVKPLEPDLDQIMAGKFNSLRDHPHLAARLRQRVSPQQAGIALQALLRRDELDPAARLELFSELASHFRSLVAFPPDSADGLTDEQYVRNVVDILFRPRTESRP
jgi:uncharacterized RDD family membrane protein YckC